MYEYSGIYSELMFNSYILLQVLISHYVFSLPTEQGADHLTLPEGPQDGLQDVLLLGQTRGLHHLHQDDLQDTLPNRL